MLDQALKTGAITREENTAFRDAIASQQDYADDTLKSVPFVAQPIARWSFQRTQGKSRAQQIDYGTVMDLSSLVDTPPLTLVWYGGTAATVTRQFKLMSCMVGVTCFPDPHIERDTHAAEHLDPALERYLDGLASRMQAWPRQRRPRHAGLLRCLRAQPAPACSDEGAGFWRCRQPTCPASPCPPTKPICAATTTTTGACWRCRTAACWPQAPPRTAIRRKAVACNGRPSAD